MKTKKSIIRRYLFLSLITGILMGLIFPVFASLFTSYKQPSYQLPFSISCIVAGVLVGVISFTIGRITLISAIKSLDSSFDQVRQGDLTTRTVLDSNDEIGHLATSFNQFMESVQTVFNQVKMSSMTITNLTMLLAEVANTSANAAKEVVHATETLADGASIQNEQLFLIKSQVEKSAIETIEGFSRADAMLSTSKHASQVAKEGSVVMQEVVNQFTWVRNTIEFATESIQNLGKRSNEIGDIVNVITEIANQTNLLALNAAIEAARAGESGRGFSVVAEEIRKLSDSTSQASKIIANLISDTQSETIVTVKSMESNLEKINVQMSSIQKSGDALEIIVASAKKTEDDAIQIHNIYAKIQKMSEDITQAVSQIAAIVNDNAAFSEEVAAASNEQYDAVEDINSSTKELTDLVKSMTQEMSKYKTN